MGILDLIFHRSTGIDDRTGGTWLFDALGGEKTASGVTVNPDSAMAFSAYFACLRVYSEDLGSLPLHLYRETGERSREKAKDHWAYKLLHDAPSPNMTAMAFRQTLVHRAMGWGGGFAEIIPSKGGQVEAMEPIHSARVRIGREKDWTVYYMVRRQDDPSKWDKWPQERMFHLIGFSPDGIQGYAYSALAAGAIGLGLAAETFGARFFGGGAHAGTVLETEGDLKPEDREYLERKFNESRQGADKSFKTIALTKGLKLARALGIPPEEAQFLETRHLQVEEICRFCRVPPHKIAHLLRATFDNIAEQNREWRDCLLPWAVRFEQEAKRKLFPDEDGIYCEHNFEGLLRADPEKRAAYERAGFFVGKFSINDLREHDNLNPLPGPEGDVHWIQQSMVPVDEAAKPKPDPPPQLAANAGIGGVPPDEQQNPDEDKDEDSEAEAQAQKVVGPLFAAAGKRVVGKEIKAVRRAAKKHAGNPEAFRAWADGFFARQVDYLVEAFGPAVTAWARLVMASETLDLKAVLQQYAARTMRSRERAALQIFDAGSVGRGGLPRDELTPLTMAATLLHELENAIARNGESDA